MVSLSRSLLRPVALTAAGACLFLATGCSQPTPEERLLKARQSWGQNDTFGAEVELRKLVEKYPEDPAAIDARMMLASIYARDERLDDALAECQAALEKVSLNNDRGIALLRQYMDILKARKRHSEGLAKLEAYEKEYANDQNVLGNLRFARADLQSHAGETSAARSTLATLADNTTNPVVLTYVRRMTAQTYLIEKDTTGAIRRVQQDYDKAKTDMEKLALNHELASLYGIANDYTSLRAVVEEVTRLTDKAITNELDRNIRLQLAMETAQFYQQMGNLKGSRDIFEAIREVATIPEMARIVPDLAVIYIREGRTSDAINAFRDAGKMLSEVPNSPAQAFLNQADMIQNLMESNKLPPTDQTTMTLKFRSDAPLGLTTLDLIRKKTGVANSGSNPAETTGTAQAQPAVSDPTTTTP